MSHRDAGWYTPVSVQRCDDCGECRECVTELAQQRLDRAIARRRAAEQAHGDTLSEYVAAYCEVLEAAKALDGLEVRDDL